MKSLVIKNKRLRLLFNKSEIKNKIVKFLLINLKSSIKTTGSSFYNVLRKHSVSKTKLKRHCTISGRSKGVSREYGISRIQLKEMIKFGVIPGYHKAVW
jgi:small subunit ribosomal protein S14